MDVAMKIISEPKSALQREMRRLQKRGRIRPLKKCDWQPGGRADGVGKYFHPSPPSRDNKS